MCVGGDGMNPKKQPLRERLLIFTVKIEIYSNPRSLTRSLF